MSERSAAGRQLRRRDPRRRPRRVDPGPAAQAGSAPRRASSSPRSATGPRPRPPSRSASRPRRSPATTSAGARPARSTSSSEQIHKCGLRFWFPAGDNSDLAAARRARPARSTRRSRATSSTAAASRTSSASRCVEAGVDLFGGCLRPGRRARRRPPRGHVDARRRDARPIKARWVVDAAAAPSSSRRSSDLLEDNGHVVNSVVVPARPAGSTSRTGPTPTTRSSSGAWRSAASACSARTTSAARATGCG